MLFTVRILGNSAALPAQGRHPSAQVLQIDNDLFLIDCGEGTQMRMSDFKVKRSKINHIFISHLHGDHVFGLPGLITSFVLNGRKDPLTVYGPSPIQHMLTTVLESSQVRLNFELNFVELEIREQEIYSHRGLTITAFPLEHRIPTVGYHFSKVGKGNHFDREKLRALEISPDGVKSLLDKGSWENAVGKVIKLEDVTDERILKASYAYCSDTRYFPAILPIIESVDLLYHESTYGDEMEHEAHARFHSTSRQAALIAVQAKVGRLMLGHFSSRYSNLDQLLEQARTEFQNTFLSVEGEVYTIEAQ
ncbi:MAG: ribonuclease Z [Saprospiraceae bacterium]